MSLHRLSEQATITFLKENNLCTASSGFSCVYITPKYAKKLLSLPTMSPPNEHGYISGLIRLIYLPDKSIALDSSYSDMGMLKEISLEQDDKAMFKMLVDVIKPTKKALAEDCDKALTPWYHG